MAICGEIFPQKIIKCDSSYMLLAKRTPSTAVAAARVPKPAIIVFLFCTETPPQKNFFSLEFCHTCILFFLLEKTMVILSASVEEYHTYGIFCGKSNTKPRKWRSIGGCLKTPCHSEQREKSFSNSSQKLEKERSFVTSFLRMTKRKAF